VNVPGKLILLYSFCGFDDQYSLTSRQTLTIETPIIFFYIFRPHTNKEITLERRNSPLDLDPGQFRKLGHQLIDDIAEFLETIRERPVTRGESPEAIRKLLPQTSMPEKGADASVLLQEATKLLVDHSLFNGHQSFYGYITSSAAPIGALGDLLASAVNPNVGSFQLSPVATEIEVQTIRWISELIGYVKGCGGILVSGGNMANFVCFLAARKARAAWDVRGKGITHPENRMIRIYATRETHTWLQKAADLFGLGTDAIRWVETDRHLRMDPRALRSRIMRDKKYNEFPLLVVANAGTVSTGVVDPLREIGSICREEDVWLHIDGAYGAIAGLLPDAPEDLKFLDVGDSLAVDPHKWLYTPLEAGCALVRDPACLRDAFSFHVPYYRFGNESKEPPVNFFEYGPQNSRGFRALKVWLGLRQVGKEGYRQMVSDDIALSKALFKLMSSDPEIETFTQSLSIATFRYAPRDIDRSDKSSLEYLNELNEELLNRMQSGGEAYLSNAMVDGVFLLRACIVNFRTTMEEIHSLPELVKKIGRQVDKELRPRSTAKS